MKTMWQIYNRNESIIFFTQLKSVIYILANNPTTVFCEEKFSVFIFLSDVSKSQDVAQHLKLNPSSSVWLDI